MRNSDPDAAVYWLARMLEAGEDPLYVARRVTRFASEDVGLADSRALEVAVAAYQACHFIGMPECYGALDARGGLHVPRAQVQRAVYGLRKREKGRAHQLAEPVPLVIRNAPTRLMKELDYGKGYQYAHDAAGEADRHAVPAGLAAGREYYRPTEQGLEAKYKARLEQIREWKRQHRNG